jgi:hypothetical protein
MAERMDLASHAAVGGAERSAARVMYIDWAHL